MNSTTHEDTHHRLSGSTRREFLKLSSAAVVCLTGAKRASSDEPRSKFVLSSERRQRILGWGCFPGWVAWDEKIGTDKTLQDAVYRDLGMNVLRIPIMPEYAHRDGSLNVELIDKYLVAQIQTALEYGVTKWIVTTWSPPSFMKTIDDDRDTVNGEVNHLKPEYEDDFVKYYARVLAYLRDVKKVPLPLYAALQNEPDAIVTWPGCVYPPDQWRRVVKKFRKALDAEKLSSIKIHGTDHNHDTLRKYFGEGLAELVSEPGLFRAMDGIAFHSYNEGANSGGAAAIDARNEILKFRDVLKPGSEIWMTENCTTVSEGFTDSAIRHLRSMMRDIGYLESNYYLYWLGSSDKEKFGGEELITKGTKTKLFFVFQKLWHAVVPDEFFVRTFQPGGDAAFSAYGPDPMDMLAFTGEGKSVILLTNGGSEAKNLTLSNLAGTRVTLYRTSEHEDMAAVGTQPIVAGDTSLSLPPRSILLCETNQGI